ncbi:hypothetical protein BKE30_14950 [Alkanindiges hydrocarboniclasticus]|uniref:Outer membrane lipoprotein carrier protein LolA n=1 Tax=Alkanindiges hydrocarboniclasticus TaxID=1907941 RepID=A0A1S8CQY9_9GAMM|nr:hypothetical protein BKE30_14950 [Alkanindiges hydrocarboniclasticus]
MRTLPTALMLIGLISPLPTYAQLSLQQLQLQAYQLDPQLQYLIRQNETDNLRVQQSGRLAKLTRKSPYRQIIWATPA